MTMRASASQGAERAPEGVDEAGKEGWTAGRVATVGALLAAVVAVVVVLFGGGKGSSYRLLFEDAGQLVKGNQVLVAGHTVGSVEDVTLTDDYQAEIEISTDEPLHEGTTAVIRTTSLSGIANRYIALDPGAEDAPELEDGAVLTQTDTTSPVGLDQLFNTFTPRTRKGLRNLIQGFAAVQAGRAEQANQTYRYINPALVSTQRLFGELTRDERAFTEFLVDSSGVVTALARRRDDLSSLTQNANEALGAVARQNTALDRALVALPPAVRQANTTFVNLRAALDDLDPLVATSKSATRDLAPFLRRLRPVAAKGVPVFRDLRRVVFKKGKANDLTNTLDDLPGAQRSAHKAVPRAIQAIDDSLPFFQFARPYTPDLVGVMSRLGQSTSYYDGNGHYARAAPASSNIFQFQSATGNLDPIPPADQYDFFDTNPLGTGIFTRCPGGATQRNSGWTATGTGNDHPFTDDGNLLGGPPAPAVKCDTGDVPPGFGP